VASEGSERRPFLTSKVWIQVVVVSGFFGPYYSRFFSDHKTEHGLRSDAITDLRRLTAFFAWTAWASAATRPGHNYSYTNNWPSRHASTTSRLQTSSSGRFSP
jgi:nitric oxide reductase large subunit